jgi:ELWxxDGT repeat protein
MSSRLTVVQVADINPSQEGPAFTSSSPSDFTKYRGDLYFKAYEPEHGFELYKVNQEDAITRITDFFPGEGLSSTTGLAEYRGNLYFAARQFEFGGPDLYKLAPDGSVTQVGDISVSDLQNVAEYRGELYFTGNDFETGAELYKITKNGTIAQVADINQGSGSSFIEEFTQHRGELYSSRPSTRSMAVNSTR